MVYLPTFVVEFLMVNVGKYTIHGSYGLRISQLGPGPMKGGDE